jgi:DNA-binding NarL/FixJ family response regulator
MFGEVTDRQRLRNTAEALALDAEGARLEGVATAATWAAVRDSWAAVPFPYQAAYASGRLALVAEAADHGAATAALRDAVATARRLGAVPMLAWLSGIARQLHVPIDSRARGDRPEAAPSRPFGLSVRELEVLELVAVGHTNRRIADDLFITESTAGVHVSNILSKLGVTSRTEAAALAIRSGIVGPADPIDP